LKAASTPSEPDACGAGGGVFFGAGVEVGVFSVCGAGGFVRFVFVVRCRSVVVDEFEF